MWKGKFGSQSLARLLVERRLQTRDCVDMEGRKN